MKKNISAKALSVRVLNNSHLILILMVLGVIFGLSGNAKAATYSVCASGCSETTIQAVFDSNDLEPGDIVEVQADTVGGSKTYNEQVTWGGDDAGDSSSQVTLQGRSGDIVIIDGEDTRSYCIYNDEVDYTTIKSLTVQDSTNRNINNSGTTDGVIVEDVTSVGGVSSFWFNAGTGIEIRNNTINQPDQYGLVFYNGDILDATVDNNNFIGVVGKTHTVGLHMGKTSNLVFTNNTISNWSTLNWTNPIFRFISPIDAVISNNTATDCDGHSFSMEGGTSSGENNIATNPGNTGFSFSGNVVSNFDNLAVSGWKEAAGILVEDTSDVIVSNSEVSISNRGVESHGFAQRDAAKLTCTNCIAHDAEGDGFNSSGTGSITCNKCLSYNNGITTNQSAGDGYTSHDDSTLNLYGSIAYGNRKSGAAVTGTSSGEIKNCSFYDNYESSFGSGWDSTGDIGIGINATGTWDVKNNITQGHPVEMMISANAITGGANITSNYNNFYDSLGGIAFDYDGTLYNFLNYKTASPTLDTNSQNSDPLFTSASTNDFTLNYLSPAIDSGTDTSLTTDYAGNPIYGTMDMGAYEYQPPHTIGTDRIDIGAGARIYGDGKFRNVATTSSLGADLEIKPQADFESFTSTQTRPFWMDITDLTWTAQEKQWTESSEDSSLTNTVHTIGDATSGVYYHIKVDGEMEDVTGTNCENNICLADANGNIEFTYTGTYSTHIFNITPRDEEIVAELTDVQLRIDRNNKTLNEDKRVYYEGGKTKLKGTNSVVADGRVKIYKNGKKYATAEVDENGNWDKNISLKHTKTYKIKIKFYDKFGTLRDKKEYKIKVDTEKPIFTDSSKKTITRTEKIKFSATDERSGISHYKVKLLDGQGKILRKWKKQKSDSYAIPEKVKSQVSQVVIRAYDKAGNHVQRRFSVR